MVELSNFDFSNPGIALALLGYFGFIFRDIPQNIWSLIKQKYSISIEACSQNYLIYTNTITYLIHKFPKLKHHIQLLGYDEISVTLADGLYFFMIDPFTWVFIDKYTMNNSSYSEVHYYIRCQIIGLNRFKFLYDYNKYITNQLPNLDMNLQIKYFNDTHNYIDCTHCKKRSFDHIYLKQDIKENIISIIDKFIQSKEYYDEHGLTYKLGIILTGPPGSGKSSIAKAIASYIGWSIFYVSINKGNFDSKLSDTVILLEDIDCLVNETREKDSFNDKKLSIHSLLNYLDGILSPENCIFIATTNYPEKLDQALLRPGRFDYCFHIELADRQVAEQVCDSFEIGYDILKDIKFPCSIAQIQNKIIINKLSSEKM